jgi:hypothetical protein
MSRLAFFVLFVVSMCSAGSAAAQPSELTRSCIAASTSGQTERDEGRLLDARAQFLSCAREECPAIVKKSCATWLNELAPRIPSVVVRVHEANQRDLTGAQVAIDDEAVTLDGRPVMLDPGTHTITVELDQRAPVKRTFLLGEREQARLLSVELPAPPVAPAPAAPIVKAPERVERPAPKEYTLPVATWVLAGVGVAELTTFVALRVKAQHDFDQLQNDCAPTCTRAQTDAGYRKALAADISLGIGIAALSGATAWALGHWLRHRHDERMQLSLAPTTRGACATFVSRY